MKNSGVCFLYNTYIFKKLLSEKKKFICKSKDKLPRSHTHKVKDMYTAAVAFPRILGQSGSAPKDCRADS